MTDQLTPAEGITVTHYRGQRDGVPVVQIDTAQDAGWLRVNLNDGPPLYDGDPEQHDAPGAFRGPSAPDSILVQGAPESAQQIADAVIAAGYGDAETFALALRAQPIDAHTVAGDDASSFVDARADVASHDALLRQRCERTEDRISIQRVAQFRRGHCRGCKFDNLVVAIRRHDKASGDVAGLKCQIEGGNEPRPDHPHRLLSFARTRAAPALPARTSLARN